MALAVSLAGVSLIAQQQSAPVPKLGIKAVQRPMSMIVPDAEYPIVGGPDWLAMGENQVWTNSRAQDLVSRHDGLIEFDSRPGQTIFTILLPLHAANTGQ